MEYEQPEETMQEKINKGIPINKNAFSRSQGIFHEVYFGYLTEIVKRFNNKGN